MKTQQTPKPQRRHSLQRLVRIPWALEEDADILRVYQHANGGFPTYAAQAQKLNREHHEGKSVRSAASVRRRECALLTGKANGQALSREGAAATNDETVKP
jgi:hypothetical protein